MALKHTIEWDPEEVAAGYDFSSIYEGVDENTTVPVISSVVNTTDQAGHSAINITAVVKEVTKQVVEKVANTINSTLYSTTMAPTTSSSPASISHLVKKAVEHLGKEPNISVATVCIIFFNSITHYSFILYILNNILQYIFIFLGQQHLALFPICSGGGYVGILAGPVLPGI